MRFLAGGNIHVGNLEKISGALGYRLKLSAVQTVENKIRLFKKRIKYSGTELCRFCRENGIKSLSVFGSAVRGDFSRDSDIDLLIEFNKAPDFFEFASIEDKLRKIFKTNRNLDVVTIKSVSPILAREIIKECEVLYEEAA